MNADELLAAKKLRETTLHLDVGGSPVAFHLRALPRRHYREILEAHPSVKEDADWNPDTFPPALLAACLVEPEFSVEQTTRLWDEWETEEASRLFLVAYYLNEDVKRLGFMSLGSAGTGGSELNSTTAPPEESPTPNS